MKRCIYRLGALGVVIAFSGCASYPERMRTLKTQLELGLDPDITVEYTAGKEKGGNALLTFEEKARLLQIQGKYRESADAYRKAMDFCSMQQDKAVISISDTLKTAWSSTYGNDLSLDYPVTAFDQMMVYSLDAFNRIALAEWDSFGVDVRNLEKWRNEANEIIVRDIEELNKGLGKKREKFLESAQYTGLMGKEATFCSGIRKSTDNVLALYLIALYHELSCDNLNALKAYRDIERISPGLPVVRNGIARVSGETLPLDEGEVVLFLEEGFIPQKRALRFEYGGLFSTIIVELPYYAAMDSMPYESEGAAVLLEDGLGVAATSPLCDLGPLVVRAHEERLRGILARQYSRTTVKAVTRGLFAATFMAGLYSSDRDTRGLLMAIGLAGLMVSDIMDAITANADLRSWLLLPRQIQVARFSMKAGRHKMTFDVQGKRMPIDVEVRPGGMTIVHGIVLPNDLNCFSSCVEKNK